MKTISRTVCSFCQFSILSMIITGAMIFLIGFPSVSFSTDPPLITTPGDRLPLGVLSQHYRFQLEYAGGNHPVTWRHKDGTLPTGLVFDLQHGQIYGIPAEEAIDRKIEIEIKDNQEKPHARNFWISILPTEEARNSALGKCFLDVGSKAAAGDLSSNISVGPTLTTQLVRYNLATEKASFNARGIGVGAAFRFYNDNDMDASPGTTIRDIRRIKPECRATTLSTFEGDQSQYKASSWLSISPVIFASVEESQGNAANDLSVQPAIVFGFLRDLINFGVGWNLAGPNRGQAFLLMGIGTGFKF